MSKNDIRIEKLCGPDNWVDSHVRFTRIGDTIRIKDEPDVAYEVVSEAEWCPSDLMWTVDIEEIEQSIVFEGEPVDIEKEETDCNPIIFREDKDE